MSEEYEGVGDPRLQAEGELALARIAWEGGDLAHAADHVAGALAHDPVLPEAHELLAKLAAHPGGGPGLFTLGDEVFLGTALARAHVLAYAGEHQQALYLLVSVQSHQVEGRWAHVPWVLDPDLPGRLPAEALAELFGRLIPALQDPVPEEQRAALEPYVVLVANSVRAHPDDPTLGWIGSMLVRRAGHAEEAAELAERAYAAQPSHMAAIAAGSAYRNLERWDEAEGAMRRALSHDPDNLHLRTDLGELLHTAGRKEEGLDWVEAVLKHDPGHESAFPTACGMRFEHDGDLAHLVRLADHLRERPDNGHADRVLAQHSAALPWLSGQSGPTESVIDVLFQMLEKEDGPGGGSLQVSAPESPSAFMAFHRAVPGFVVEITDVPEPDPRRTVPEVYAKGPVKEVTRRVWTYAGMVAAPAVPPPDERVLEAVAQVAAAPWRHLPAAVERASGLAGLPVDDLLGVLVHPPEQPFGQAVAWPYWIRQVQALACLGIAGHALEQPWRESERRAVLVDLAYGPEDWVTEAALLALVATAWVDEEARADVAELVSWRYMAAVKAAATRPVTLLDSLRHLVLATPDLHPDVRSLAEGRPYGEQ
jgi:tetratricopeptide (TPR) repeat protein